MARSPGVKAVFAHVTADLAAPVTLGSVAEAVGCHPGDLTDLVRNETGMPASIAFVLIGTGRHI